jgi:hypothetical protein
MFKKIPLLIHIDNLFPSYNPSDKLSYFKYKENLDAKINKLLCRESWYSSTLVFYLEETLNYQVIPYVEYISGVDKKHLQDQYNLEAFARCRFNTNLNISEINNYLNSNSHPFVVFIQDSNKVFNKELQNERLNNRRCLGIIAGTEGVVQSIDIPVLISFSKGTEANKATVSN